MGFLYFFIGLFMLLLSMILGIAIGKKEIDSVENVEDVDEHASDFINLNEATILMAIARSLDQGESRVDILIDIYKVITREVKNPAKACDFIYEAYKILMCK